MTGISFVNSELLLRESAGCVRRAAECSWSAAASPAATSRGCSVERGATIVSPENFMLYTPILPEAASGTLEPRHVVVPLRQMCPHAELLLGRVTAIDEERRGIARVETADAGTDEVRYEQLVRRARRGRTHAARPRPRRARARVQGPRRRDSSPQPRPARARGGGRRARPGAARGAPHLRLRRRRLRGRRGARGALRPRRATRCATTRACATTRQRWVLVDAAPKILPEIPPRLGDYAARELARPRRRDPRRRRRSSRSSADEAVLSNGERIPTHTLVWTAGVRAAPAARRARPAARRARPRPRRLAAPRGGPRAGLVARRLRRRPERAPRPADVDPPTCQHALRQARRLAKNLHGDAASRTATGCSARWRRSAATRGSRT